VIDGCEDVGGIVCVLHRYHLIAIE